VLGERSVPCPTLDLSGGFRAFFDAATNMTSNPPFDPYKNDVNFLLATWSLEEIGATGDKVGLSARLYNSCVLCQGDPLLCAASRPALCLSCSSTVQACLGR
jgi:hypothetical protein